MDNYTWSLMELYPSFESELFKNDYLTLEKNINSLNKWCNDELKNNSNAAEKLEYYINCINIIGDLNEKLINYCMLTLSTDSKNNTAIKYSNLIEEKISTLSASNAEFKKFVYSLESIPKTIKSSAVLKEHKFFLDECKKEGRYILSPIEEAIISKMKITGSFAWENLYDTISSNLKIPFKTGKEEKTLPLSAIRNLAYNNSRKIRKKAYKAELKALKSIEDTASSCINSIKGQVITEAQLRGYNSSLEMTLIQSRLDKKTLDILIDSLKNALPVFRKYLVKKAELLGYSEGLPFYDLFAPIGKNDIKFTYVQAQEFIIKNFSKFNPKMGDYAEMAFKNNWIDLYPSVGKRGGAFCTNLHSIGESRILTNFTGNFSDVITLAHELGHGYHGFKLKNKSFLNSDYPMPLAETASTFCETIVKNAALKNASDNEKMFILENDISDNTQIIVDILSRFIFEDNVFKKREKGPLSAEELNEIMLESQEETYGSGLNKKFMHKYMWICKPHYYDSDYNYYNFPYAFGLLFAKGLYQMYINEGSTFSNKYDKLLEITGNSNIYTTAKSVGIDIHTKKFWNNSIDILIQDIEKFLLL